MAAGPSRPIYLRIHFEAPECLLVLLLKILGYALDVRPGRPIHAGIVTTPRQIRAARALLGWSQEELADRAGVARSALARLEAGRADPRAATVEALEDALQAGGVEFLRASDGGEGVRLGAGSQSPRKGGKAGPPRG